MNDQKVNKNPKKGSTLSKIYNQVKHFFPAFAVMVIVALAVDTNAFASEAPDLTVLENSSNADTGDFDLTNCADGTYIGKGKGYAGYIAVEVQIKDKAMTSIVVVEVEADDAAYVEKAKAVISGIMASQSLSVDTVSGATYSSNGIILAVKDAISQASGNGQSSYNEPASEQKEQPEEPGWDDTDSSAYNDGIYYGTGKGYKGNITVKVAVSSKKIKEIEITDHIDDIEYLEKAKKTILPAIINEQSTNVDAVSGATYSSNGIILAVRDALKKSIDNKPAETPPPKQEPEEPEESEELPDDDLDGKKYKDGKYTGSARGYNGDVSVEVEIKNGDIKAINITSHTEDITYFNMATGVIPNIIAKKSTNVDVISGATFTSNAIIKAARIALNKAVIDEDDAEDDDDDDDDDDDGDDNTDGDVDPPNGGYKNGSYTGYGMGHNDYIDIMITVVDNKISGIEIIAHNEDEPYFSSSLSILSRIINKQTAEGVDTVSGATYSSQGILDAVAYALSQAQID